MLRRLKRFPEAESHLVVSEGALRVMACETGLPPEELFSLASAVYDAGDLAAPIASSSFQTDGMIIAPCSMKTLAGVACGYSENLVLRTADVTINEGRPLVLAVRESPLSPSISRTC